MPEEAATILRDLSDDPSRQNATMALARLNGWSARAIGDAIGTTYQNVDLRIKGWLARDGQYTEAVELPLPPSPAAKGIKPPKKTQLLIKPEIAARLRALHAVARTVNGGTAADDPRRNASVELAASLANLIDQGVTAYRLAKEIGVTRRAIAARLERHGYRTPAPSANQRYVGHQTFLRQEGFCINGHRLAEVGIYGRSDGQWRCKECHRRNAREYYRRKAATA